MPTAVDTRNLDLQSALILAENRMDQMQDNWRAYVHELHLTAQGSFAAAVETYERLVYTDRITFPADLPVYEQAQMLRYLEPMQREAQKITRLRERL